MWAKQQPELSLEQIRCHGAPADFGVHFQTDLACFCAVSCW
jgi:hypothetical protein